MARDLGERAPGRRRLKAVVAAALSVVALEGAVVHGYPLKDAVGGVENEAAQTIPFQLEHDKGAEYRGQGGGRATAG